MPAPTEDDTEDPMIVLAGHAVFEWSRVELAWAGFFRDLLFDGIGDTYSYPSQGEVEEPKDLNTKIARANAVFFNLGSGDSQRRLLESVAEVVLANRADLLKEVRTLLKNSRTLAHKRNGIIHAYYDRPLKFDGRSIEFGPISVEDFGGARKKPEFDFAMAVNEFRRHGNEVREAWLKMLNLL